MMHWILNNNTCALSLLEVEIRKKLNNGIEVDRKNECFTCRIIDPIYDLTANYDNYATFIYTITTLLWLISIGKLSYKVCTGEINCFAQLFM